MVNGHRGLPSSLVTNVKMSSQTASTEGTTGTTGGSLGMLRHLIIVVNKSLQEILLNRHLKIMEIVCLLRELCDLL